MSDSDDIYGHFKYAEFIIFLGVKIMVGTKVHVTYEIKNPPLIVKPTDEIEGKIIVTNGEKKDKKLKKLFIELYDMYQALITRRDPESGEETESWVPQKKELKQWDIASNDKLKSGEKKEFPFTIELPNWQKKKGKGKEDDKFNQWRLELHFNQKTGMVANPSFGDPKLAKKQKKAAKKAAEAKAKDVTT
ncbi:MAG: hypothetical protein ACXAC5_13460 [Promethearchaeota archaeon]|jgi:hypothetical protein